MDKIKVKQYLTFKDKCQLAKDVCEMSFEGIEYDPMVRECAQVFMIAKMYSDIDIEMTDGKEDAVKTYDRVMREDANGIYLKEIVSKIPRLELKKIEEMIENLIQEKKRRSSIVYEITKKFSSMNVEEILNEIKNFDMNKFREVSQIIELNNSVTKKA